MEKFENKNNCSGCRNKKGFSSERNQYFCRKCNIWLEKRENKEIIKNNTSLEEGKRLFALRIEDAGIYRFRGYTITINNVRIGEVVDIKIKKVSKNKAVAFAEVINYRKTVGKPDFYREFNCPQETHGIAHGGMNRIKCLSVIYPEGRKNRREWDEIKPLKGGRIRWELQKRC